MCSLSSAVLMHDSWTIHNHAILSPNSNNVSVRLNVAGDTPGFARVQKSSFYPLTHTFTITGWFLWQEAGSSDFQYFFVHSEKDGSPRYQALALDRKTNRFIFSYRAFDTEGSFNCYVYFNSPTGTALNDASWHFFALRVGLLTTGPSPRTSIQLWLDNTHFESPSEVFYRNIAQTGMLPQPVAEPADTEVTEVRIGGRPSSITSPDNGVAGFVGDISQLAFLKNVQITGEQFQCLIACGEKLIFSPPQQDLITPGSFQGRERSIAMSSSSGASAEDFQFILRTLQFESSAVPAPIAPTFTAGEDMLRLWSH